MRQGPGRRRPSLRASIAALAIGALAPQLASAADGASSASGEQRPRQPAISATTWKPPLGPQEVEPRPGVLRFYDPKTGRFVSRDPLGLWGDSAQNGNGQGYCGHNPVNRVDPWGESAEDLAMAERIIRESGREAARLQQELAQAQTKLANVEKKFGERLSEYRENPRGLPDQPTQPGARNADSRAGHRSLINQQKGQMAMLRGRIQSLKDQIASANRLFKEAHDLKARALTDLAKPQKPPVRPVTGGGGSSTRGGFIHAGVLLRVGVFVAENAAWFYIFYAYDKTCDYASYSMVDAQGNLHDLRESSPDSWVPDRTREQQGVPSGADPKQGGSARDE